MTKPRWAPSSATEAITPSDWLTVSEAARHIGRSRDAVNGWIAKGRLPAVHRDGLRWVRPADLHAAQEAVHLGGVIPACRLAPQRAGHRLRRLRKAAGCTQQALASASGIEHEMISRLETGQQIPRASAVQKLACALAVDPTIFVDDTPIDPAGMTTDQAAARLAVPQARVQRWMRTGKLPGKKVAGQWRMPVEAVQDLERYDRLRGRSRRLDPRYRDYPHAHHEENTNSVDQHR